MKVKELWNRTCSASRSRSISRSNESKRSFKKFNQRKKYPKNYKRISREEEDVEDGIAVMLTKTEQELLKRVKIWAKLS